ncbi:MAG TPA: C39 family peptidase, partial [Anaerolineales bacterium]|nr:C39 family peptidase [Anaerolineales bacterium]
GVIDPAGPVPTARPTNPADLPSTPQPDQLPTHQPTPTLAELTPTIPIETILPTTTPAPLPESVILEPPAWQRQDINNCGPATLAMYLNYYGWEGDQFDIQAVIKPERADRNVNIEELAYFAWNYAGWLNLTYRVGGDIELMKTFIASGIPVMIEEGDRLAESYWPDDDMWAGHFLLLTGYDDDEGVFIAQDSFRQPDLKVAYADTDYRWKHFNRVFIVAYLPDQEAAVQSILGDDWDVSTNRQQALETAQAEIDADPNDALAWFNLGSNLVYFERYEEAAEAYDQARSIGLPQRMFRYQLGAFHAYFHSGRYDELLALAEHTLQITPNLEEANLWKGWALYNLGNNQGAIEFFRNAYWANPNSVDAQYALEFMGAAP